MATYGATQRPSITSRATSDNPDESKKDFKRVEFKLVCPFNIPSSPEAASLRIIRNLNHFALYYTHFIWIILFITLIPQRKVSLILLVIMTYVASLYLLLLSAVPISYNMIHKILDKRIVLSLIVIATMVQLIATGAGLHLVFTLAGSVPVVLAHAVLWVLEDFSVEDRDIKFATSSGEFLPLVHQHDESTSVMA